MLLKNKKDINENNFIFLNNLNKIKGIIKIIEDLANPDDRITLEENSCI